MVGISPGGLTGDYSVHFVQQAINASREFDDPFALLPRDDALDGFVTLGAMIPTNLKDIACLDYAAWPSWLAGVWGHTSRTLTSPASTMSLGLRGWAETGSFELA
jgi:hypothetical protein